MLQEGDAVVALHPDFSFSYSPGVVVGVTDQSEKRFRVRLYNGTEHALSHDDVYLLANKNKYSLDVAYIRLCEDQWVGQAVVFRNADTGSYQLGE